MTLRSGNQSFHLLQFTFLSVVDRLTDGQLIITRRHIFQTLFDNTNTDAFLRYAPNNDHRHRRYGQLPLQNRNFRARVWTRFTQIVINTGGTQTGDLSPMQSLRSGVVLSNVPMVGTAKYHFDGRVFVAKTLRQPFNKFTHL